MTDTGAPDSRSLGRLLARHVRGLVRIALAWSAGLAIAALLGFPASIGGLVVLAGWLLASPQAMDAVEPTADVAVRWLPLLFVPLAVEGASVLAEADPAAVAVAVLVSVPAGYAVVARLAR